MKHGNFPDASREEAGHAEIIRRAGSRGEPPAATRAAVRSAAESEWRAVVAARNRRRNGVRWSLAAAATVVAAMAAWLALPVGAPPAVAAVAAIERVEGPVSVVEPDSPGTTPIAGRTLAAGAELNSGPGGRVALALGEASVRLDGDTVLTLAAADRIVLERGAVYVDTGARGADVALRVETPLGVVEHLGTQYQARVDDGTVRVLVREGRVRLRDGGRDIETAAGERLTVQRDGTRRREMLAANDPAWDWIGEIVPVFDIENRPLTEFLGWVSRETSREVVFASPAAEQAARAVVLRGSVAGLAPDQALTAVLTTTDLVYRESDGRLLIDVDPAAR